MKVRIKILLISNRDSNQNLQKRINLNLRFLVAPQLVKFMFSKMKAKKLLLEELLTVTSESMTSYYLKLKLI